MARITINVSTGYRNRGVPQNGNIIKNVYNIIISIGQSFRQDQKRKEKRARNNIGTHINNITKSFFVIFG